MSDTTKKCPECGRTLDQHNDCYHGERCSELADTSGSAKTTVEQIMDVISEAADGVNDTSEWDEAIYGNGIVTTWGLIEQKIDKILNS